MNKVIDETNIAISYASCEGCQTVAVAIQIVLVSSNPESVTPENVAIAINEECASCETMASAYQFVVGTGDKIKLDREGREQIGQIRKAFYDLAVEADEGSLSVEQIEARLIPLVEQIKTVQAEHVVPVTTPEGKGLDGDGETGKDAQDAAPEAEPEPQETPSPSPSPSPTASEEPEESPAPEESEPAESPSPSPTS
ncbi:MAG: hypothetical protein WD178_02130 [Actinomycetota bacterium]